MRKLIFLLMILGMMSCFFQQLCFAQTGYVSDMLLLTFRQGPGNSYGVIKTLKSNTPVSILEEENGFYKVELQSGEIGWVDKKFIIFDLPKTLIIDELTKEKELLENKIATFESTAESLKDRISSQETDYTQTMDSLQSDLKTALEEKEQLENSLSEAQTKYQTLLEQSRDIQSIIKENKVLQEQNVELSKDLELYKSKNKNLFKTAMIKWFLAGVGVLLLGWILGQSVSSKKRHSSSLLD